MYTVGLRECLKVYKVLHLYVKVYLYWTRRCQFDDVEHDALVLEHMLINQNIHTRREAF